MEFIIIYNHMRLSRNRNNGLNKLFIKFLGLKIKRDNIGKTQNIGAINNF